MPGTLVGAEHSAWITVFITMGLTIQVASLCPYDCYNGGRCIETTCSCQTGWTGPSCEQAVCTLQCQNRSVCTFPNTCTCVSGWTGSTCSIPVCSPPCENNGDCSSPNSCTCQPDWTGPTCTEPVCSPKCENEGMCIAPNTCACNSSNWGGLRCDKSLCFCLNGGSCPNSSTACICPRRWKGNHCEIRSSMNLRTIMLSLSLALALTTVFLLGITLLSLRMKKSKPQEETLIDLEVQENVAYHTSFTRGIKPPKMKKKKKKTKIQYKPMKDTDVIYETPLPSTRALSPEKESVYENASYNLYD